MISLNPFSFDHPACVFVCVCHSAFKSVFYYWKLPGKVPLIFLASGFFGSGFPLPLS